MVANIPWWITSPIGYLRLGLTPRLSIQAEAFGPLADLSGALTSAAAAADWREVEPVLSGLPTPRNHALTSGAAERRVLFHLIRATGARRVLEIGTHLGYGTAYLAAAIQGQPGAHLVTVDILRVNDIGGPWSAYGCPATPAELVRLAAPNVPVDFVQSEAAAFLARTAETFDFVFVDGNHAGAVAYREIAAISQRLARGLVVLHDVYASGSTHPDAAGLHGPRRAVHRVARECPSLTVTHIPRPPWDDSPDPFTSLAVLSHR